MTIDIRNSYTMGSCSGPITCGDARLEPTPKRPILRDQLATIAASLREAESITDSIQAALNGPCLEMPDESKCPQPCGIRGWADELQALANGLLSRLNAIREEL